MKGFVPLREEAEKRGKLIKAASDRKAPPDEACKLIGNFGQAEMKMIKYVEANSARCGIPPQIADQLKNGHKNTEKMQKKVCGVAQQAQQRGPAGPSLSEVLGSSAALPEAQRRQEGRQHLRYAERQRSHAMTRSDERRDRPRCRCDRQLGRYARAVLVAALSAAFPFRPADRLVAAADAVLVVGGAGRRHRPRRLRNCRS